MPSSSDDDLEGLIEEYFNKDEGGISFSEAVNKVKKHATGAKKALTGTRTNFPPEARKVLERYGNMKFTEVKVCRKPLDNALQSIIKLFSSSSASSFDKLFHLSIRFKLEDGKWLRLDKRQVLHAVIDDEKTNTTCVPVEVSSSTAKTVNELLSKTEKKVGVDRFYKYRSTTWNCQRFVMDIIEANSMKVDKSFVMQSVKGIVHPIIEKLGDLATDASAKFNLVTEGLGLKNMNDSDLDELVSGGSAWDVPAAQFTTFISNNGPAGNGRPRRSNAWTVFVKEFAARNKDLPFNEMTKAASAEYAKLGEDQKDNLASVKPAPRGGRRPSAWTVFNREFRAANPSMSFADASRAASNAYAKLSPTEKNELALRGPVWTEKDQIKKRASAKPVKSNKQHNEEILKAMLADKNFPDMMASDAVPKMAARSNRKDFLEGGRSLQRPTENNSKASGPIPDVGLYYAPRSATVRADLWRTYTKRAHD